MLSLIKKIITNPVVRVVPAAVACLVTTVVVINEGRFWYHRHMVLTATPAELAVIGPHFIVGFQKVDTVRELARKGAIGGIFITARNVAHKSRAQVREEIERLQALRPPHSPGPLIVAADQEGGMVSRLSPPLPLQPPLSQVVGISLDRHDLVSKTRGYAEQQARDLAALGVTLNLSPVVDLPHADSRGVQPLTRLDRRAIASDKRTVALVAGAYCDTMVRFDVLPTLKHFPGLGRIPQETHRNAGVLRMDPAQLCVRDWVPFRQVLDGGNAALMLGHVRLAAVDPDNLVSCSPGVVQGILRRQWGFDGLLITDDLTMRPAARRNGGIGATAVEALNAGVDLLLISRSERSCFAALAAVLSAHRQGRLDLRRLNQSRLRLTGFRQGNTKRDRLRFNQVCTEKTDNKINEPPCFVPI